MSCGAMLCWYVLVVLVKSSVYVVHDSRTWGVVSRWQPILAYSDTVRLKYCRCGCVSGVDIFLSDCSFVYVQVKHLLL